MKAAIVSRDLNVGKTTLTDCMAAAFLSNLVRVEVEAANTGSAKAGVIRITPHRIDELLQAMLYLEDDQNLVCDVGGSEYERFFTAIAMNQGIATEFDRFILVMKAGGVVKEDDALDSVRELIGFGVDPAKISVVFNGAAHTYRGIDEAREVLRRQFPLVFKAEAVYGFRICPTPVIQIDALYKAVFKSPDWTVEALAKAPPMWDQMKALIASKTKVPDELSKWAVLQKQSYLAWANLQAVWNEVLAAKMVAEIDAEWAATKQAADEKAAADLANLAGVA